MTKITKNLPYPPRWINEYVYNELSSYSDIGVDQLSNISPIIATTPTNTEELYDNLLQSSAVGEPLMIIYDRMITYRPTVFYGHKREQLIYFLYSTKLENVNNANIVISQLLDREDASAQDLNLWVQQNHETNTRLKDYPHNVFFHKTKVYQAQESRDVLDLASARTIYINKLIIEYDYHLSPQSLDPSGNPDSTINYI